MSDAPIHPIRRALISVSDKQGVIDFAKALDNFGVEIISTGGTGRALSEAGLAVTQVEDVTGFPEIMDGRVKTLHPKVHGGLLALRDNQEHRAAMTKHGIANIDLAVVNLYPFENTVASGADFATCMENIDIGGPALIRAAAKNHTYVTIVVDQEDYKRVIKDMTSHEGGTTLALRRSLAAKAYARTASYDAAISNWFARELDDHAPKRRVIAAELRQTLRYGENPHQRAAFYLTGEDRPGVATAQQIQGKELSYNNINDTDAAFELVAEFDPHDAPAVAIIKHANPCGVATGSTPLIAYQKALACDPVSAFGGIIALNTLLDGAAAEEIAKLFAEVIIAPDADHKAKQILSKKKNLRLLLTGGLPDPGAKGLTYRSVAGGLLVQDRDSGRVGDPEIKLKVVTKRAPTAQEMADLKFAFTVAKHVKSNTIVYAKNGATVGVGAGQMSRIDSARIAKRKAEDAAQQAGRNQAETIGSVAASDAFFPFADGLLVTAEAGATAVIQPGGSIRDDEVIAAANDAGLAMVFTGMRHFRH